MKPIKIYTASKVRHADRLRALRPHADKIHFNARWPDTATLAQNAAKPASHWLMENVDDIIMADAVFVYAEEGEHLKTALFEAGVAYAHRKHIWVIGQTVVPSDASFGLRTIFHPDYEPWCRASDLMHRANDFESAIKEVKILFKAD